MTIASFVLFLPLGLPLCSVVWIGLPYCVLPLPALSFFYLPADFVLLAVDFNKQLQMDSASASASLQ
jgi:hypothetical protein